MGISAEKLRRALARIEPMDPELVKALQKMTHAERFAIANGLWVSAREMLRSGLRGEHPDWDDAQIQAEVACKMSHGAV